MTKLRKFLPFAPISQEFREYIEREFEIQYSMGISDHYLYEPTFLSIFNFKLADSGGIFDLQRAKEIERTVYHQEVLEFLAEIGISEDREDELVIKLQMRLGENLGSWRQGFIEFYGEEP